MISAICRTPSHPKGRVPAPPPLIPTGSPRFRHAILEGRGMGEPLGNVAVLNGRPRQPVDVLVCCYSLDLELLPKKGTL